MKMKVDHDAGEFIAMAHVPKDFPIELGGMAGRILYGIRSSLDNLAWQLVLVGGGTPGKHTEFPVFEDETKFNGRAPRMMDGMSDTAKAAIERLQPFNEWPEHPEHATLWKIHDLNNIDKHRLPYITGLVLARVRGGFRHVGASGAELVYLAEQGAPIEDGAVLAHVRWDPAQMKALGDAKVDVDLEMAVDPAIQSSEAEFITPEGKPGVAMPFRVLFDIAFDYLDATLLPAFSGEFT